MKALNTRIYTRGLLLGKGSIWEAFAKEILGGGIRIMVAASLKAGGWIGWGLANDRKQNK